MTITNDAMGALQKNALVAHVKISAFSPSVRAKEIEQELARRHSSDPDRASVHLRLLDRKVPEFLACVKACADARDKHVSLTGAWREGAYRLLPLSLLDKHQSAVREAQETLSDGLARLEPVLPSILAAGKAALNGMAAGVDWPTTREILGRFKITPSYLPVPEAAPLSVSLTGAALESVLATQRAEAEASLAAMQRESLTSLGESLAKLAERMKVYDPENPGRAPFRDSAVTNILEAAASMERLNITGDQNIGALASAIQYGLLGSTMPDALRASSDLRGRVITEADILQQQIRARMAAISAAGF